MRSVPQSWPIGDLSWSWIPVRNHRHLQKFILLKMPYMALAIALQPLCCFHSVVSLTVDSSTRMGFMEWLLPSLDGKSPKFRGKCTRHFSILIFRNLHEFKWLRKLRHSNPFALKCKCVRFRSVRKRILRWSEQLRSRIFPKGPWRSDWRRNLLYVVDSFSAGEVTIRFVRQPCMHSPLHRSMRSMKGLMEWLLPSLPGRFRKSGLVSGGS